MHVDKIDFSGNSNIGMMVYVTDEVAIAGVSVTEDEVKKIEEVLNVKVYQTNICGTSLAGIFLAGFGNTLFVPSLIFDYELEVLEKTGLNIIKLDTKYTALGNNLIYKDGVAVVLPDFDAVEQLQEHCDTIIQENIADTEVTGSACVLTKKGGIIHPEISDEFKLELEKAFGVPLTRGTLNYGSPYIRSGILCNSHGFLVGQQTAGTEMTNADEALGFLENE